MTPLESACNHEIPCSASVPYLIKKNSKEVFIIQSSSPSPIKNNTPPKKGKEIMITATPVNSPTSSPTNSIRSDLDFLLSKKSLELKALTIHKPKIQRSPQISPNSSSNITVRRKNNRGSRHFRGRGEGTGRGVCNLSLIDVLIIVMIDERPLRESMAEKPSI